MVAAILGGATGPWITGVLYDAIGTYSVGFGMAAGCSLISILAIWLAAPRKVRAVAGVPEGWSPVEISAAQRREVLRMFGLIWNAS
jgi:hypothetical protein